MLHGDDPLFKQGAGRLKTGLLSTSTNCADSMSNPKSEAQLTRSSSTRKVVEEDRMSLDYEHIDYPLPTDAERESAVTTTSELRESVRNEAVPKGPRQPERPSRYTSRNQAQTPDSTKPRYGPSNYQAQAGQERPTSSRSSLLGGIIQSITGSSQPAQVEENPSGRECSHAEAMHDHAVMLEALLQEKTQMLDHYKIKAQHMEAERVRFINQLNELSAYTKKLEADLKQKTTLLDSRTMELRTAESFLTKYDDIPGDEIVNLVSDLNQQVLGIAAKCEELVKFKPVDKARSESTKKYCPELNPIIGSTLHKFLETMDNNEDPTIIQLAIQAILLYQLTIFLRNWPLSSSRSFAKNLWNLYDIIHKNGQ